MPFKLLPLLVAVTGSAGSAVVLQQTQTGGLTLETAQVILIVGGLLAAVSGAFVFAGKALLSAKDEQIVSERANARLQLEAKDRHIESHLSEIAAQRVTNQAKDQQIASHATQVIGLLQGRMDESSRVGQAMVEALHALRESVVLGEQQRGKEHAGILDSLQQLGGLLEFQHGQRAAWDGAERRKAARGGAA